MGFIEEQQLESAYVMGTYARKPVELVRGRGMQVEDSEGRTYLDFVSGVGAVSLGHCHPALVSAIEEQASTLVHVSNYYFIEHRREVAHLVSDLLNECVDEGERTPWQSFFANSGAEANECAFKLARLHAKKRAMAAAEEMCIRDRLHPHLHRPGDQLHRSGRETGRAGSRTHPHRRGSRPRAGENRLHLSPHPQQSILKRSAPFETRSNVDASHARRIIARKTRKSPEKRVFRAMMHVQLILVKR